MLRTVKFSRNFALLGIMAVILIVCLYLVNGDPREVRAQEIEVIVHGPVSARTSEEISTMPTADASEPVYIVPEGLGEQQVAGDPLAESEGPDPVLQGSAFTTEAHGELTNPIVNVNGLATGAPVLDPVGDVGPNHYVQMVNSQFQIRDKQGAPVPGGGPFAISQIWVTAGDTGECSTTNSGDPIVLYDHLADRWMLSQFDAAGPSFGMCIAISQTQDPTGLYYVYDFRIPDAQGTFPDYPKIGVWPDGYYMSTFEGGSLGAYIFERSMMLTGNPARVIEFTKISDLGAAAGFRSTRLLPSELDGPAPPTGSPNFFFRQADDVAQGGSDRLEIFEATVNWGDPLSSSFGLIQTLSPAPFAYFTCANDPNGAPRLCIDQPNTTGRLDALMGRPMWRLQYRNFGTHETLVMNKTVDADGNGNAGIRWYELRRTPPGSGAWAINQQGTYGPQAGGVTNTTWVQRWMGSAAMDKAGNIALGYNVVNDDDSNPIYPGIRYTGRLATDPAGILPQGEETIINGGTFSGGVRWGDYTSLNLDPVDGCTFWYTAEYIDAAGVRRTRIASFRFPSCNPADLSITKTASPDPAIAGEQLSYTISVTNNGPDTATNVVVTDILPAGVSYVTDTDSCVQTPPPAGELTCNLGTLLPGETNSFTIQVAIPHDFIAGTGPRSITNTASVTADQLDPNPANNTASVTTIVEDRADLELIKECKPDGAVAAGEDYTCTLIVENLGPSSARLVSLRDESVSSGAYTVTSITTDPNRADSCLPAAPIGPGSSATIECELDESLEPKDLASGGRWVIVYVVTANEPQSINNCAQVFTLPDGTPDPSSANNQTCDGVSVTGVSDLSLTKVDTPDPLDSGTMMTYILDVTNHGPSTAINVIVEDLLPAGVSISSVSGTGASSCTFGIPGDPSRATTCTFDSLPPSANVTMTIVVTVDIPGILNIAHDDASVRSDIFDPNNANNVASEDTTIRVADLRILKTSDADVYRPSSVVRYTVTVWNDGPAYAENVVVTDNLPDFRHAVFQFVDPNVCTKSGSTLTCDLGTIPAGGDSSFDIYVTIRGNQGEVSNTASVTSTTFDPNAANDSSTRVVLVKGGVNAGP